MDFSQYTQLEFRRKFFKLFGASIDITDKASGDKVGYIEMKAFKLREDVRLYADRSKDKELLRIHARSVLDFGVTYDIFESDSDTPLFSLQRKGLKSTFVRDQWQIADVSGKQIGTVQETSSSLALVRRYVDLIPFVGWAIDLIMSFFPLTYSIYDNAQASGGSITHQKNPLIVKMTLDRSDAPAELDPRIGIAVTSLLSTLDANKN